MSERHTRGALRYAPVGTATGGTRSAMARAVPFRPYVYNGGEIEPPAVTAARERHRALSAEIERLAELAETRERYRADEARAWAAAAAAAGGAP